MILINPDSIKLNTETLDSIESEMKVVYRMIMYSRNYSDDELLDHYFDSSVRLNELVSIKNAQMEAQTEEEAQSYLIGLRSSFDLILEEIIGQRNFGRVSDLLHLFRIIDPEAHRRHPNSFRTTVVQVGSYICPAPERLPYLIENFFFHLNSIRNPIVRAIYCHHELVRIHPFCDGNGRTSRMAKNWILLFDLFPPIFINDAQEKRDYVKSLNNSFMKLAEDPHLFPEATQLFFEQELDRLNRSIQLIKHSVFDLKPSDELP